MRSNNYNAVNNTSYVSLNPVKDADIRNYPEIDDGESKLHLLYPNRPMSKYYSMNKENIPNEDEEGAIQTLDTKDRERARYNERLQKTLLAGPNPNDDPTNPKMLMQPAVDPYEMIEDPQARFTTLDRPPIINDALPIPVTPQKEGFKPSPKMDNEVSEKGWGDKWMTWIAIIMIILFIGIGFRMLRR